MAKMCRWTPMLAWLFTLLVAQPGFSLEVVIEEWPVPWPDSRPRDPFVDDDGQVWFVGQKGDYVARFDPQRARFSRFPLPAGAGPHSVIAGSGAVWYAGNQADHLGRLDPATGVVETLPVPAAGKQDPHTLAFASDDNIWFTSPLSNHIGYFDITTRAYTLYDPPTPDARPYGLALDQQGTPWVALFGTHRLASVDSASGEVREVELPRREARPRRLAITPDGRIWYVDYMGGRLGRYDPGSGITKEWLAPSGERSGPYAMAADARGRLWFVETGVQPNQLVAFDPASGIFVLQEDIPSGGKTVRNMTFDEDTNSVWFGTDAGTLGRAVVRD